MKVLKWIPLLIWACALKKADWNPLPNYKFGNTICVYYKNIGINQAVVPSYGKNYNFYIFHICTKLFLFFLMDVAKQKMDVKISQKK